MGRRKLWFNLVAMQGSWKCSCLLLGARYLGVTQIFSAFISPFPCLDGKASAYNAGDLGSIPGSGRPPGEGNGNPLQYSCLENPMDGEAWWAIVHGVAKSRTRLSNLTLLLTLLCLCYILTFSELKWQALEKIWTPFTPLILKAKGK